ncbi:hypothetical protein [Gelidibacter sp.]|uniref:hypothetical protein n=1 Tax=Gelidibacter sp. TaxID=2018083 RepID=UPI0032644DEE
MKNDYLLQKEFTKWLQLQIETLSLTPHFYSSQISKLYKINLFGYGSRCIWDALENEISCNNYGGIEEIILEVLDKMEQLAFQNDLNVTIIELEGLRIGLLKYRMFLHHYIAVRNSNYKSRKRTSHYLSESKQVRLQALFNSGTSYSIPIYHDVYTYNEPQIDTFWKQLLTVFALKKVESTEDHLILNYALETLIVKRCDDKNLEVVDGGNSLILISILRHVLAEISDSKNISEIKTRNPSQLLTFQTGLNDQKMFEVMVNNGIIVNATTANTISKGTSYQLEELGLNEGYHFLQTAFRFVQFIEMSKNPQSDYYIEDLDVFIANVFETMSINCKQLNFEHSDKTYLNQNIILLENIMEWL